MSWENLKQSRQDIKDLKARGNLPKWANKMIQNYENTLKEFVEILEIKEG